jgi:cell division protein FtsW
LLGAVGVVVLLVAGVRWLYLAPPLVLGVGAVALLLALNPLRSERVYSWLHLEETRRDVGYQAWQAQVALSTGGPTGVGLNQSRLKALLPEYQTDFLFAIICEEFGFAGSLTVVALFLLFFVTGMVAAARAPDTFGRLLGTGISFLIALQALINIGVVSSALPNKGLALPFISYGGSNLMIMLVCAGVLISIARAASATSEVENAAPPVGAFPGT